MTLEYAKTPTDSTGPTWREFTPETRRLVVMGHVSPAPVNVVEAREDGTTILEITTPMNAAQRGQFLLNLEESLKADVDRGISVWLAPLGDKNSLRKLRGIQIK